MVKVCQHIAAAPAFKNFILGIILLAGVVVGMQTYKDFEAEHHDLLTLLDRIILGVFVLEVVIKIIAGKQKPRGITSRIVGTSLIFPSSLSAYCRSKTANLSPSFALARVLRVLKLVSAVPRLQVLVNAVLKSIPIRLGYVFLLGLLHFYIYGCMATFLFSDNDPLHFRNLQTSMLSLFRAVTLEDWTDLMYINMYGSANCGYDATTYAALEQLGIAGNEITSTAHPCPRQRLLCELHPHGSHDCPEPLCRRHAHRHG